jgi:hypothetical protein
MTTPDPYLADILRLAAERERLQRRWLDLTPIEHTRLYQIIPEQLAKLWAKRRVYLAQRRAGDEPGTVTSLLKAA